MKLKLLCCAPILWLPTAIANSLCPQPLRVGFDNWPPYHYYLAGGSHQPRVLQGFAVEALNGVLKHLGCQATYVERPWKRVLQDLAQGKLEVAMEAYFNEERASYAHFSIAYNPGRSRLWIRKSEAYPRLDLASWLAEGHTLGVTKEYFYGTTVAALLQRHKPLVSAVNDRQNYGKLVRGRIDGFLGDELATPWGLKEEGLDNLVVASPLTIYEAPTFFMFSKKRLSDQFVQQFNRELAAFKATEEYQDIWRRYSPAR